MKAFSTVVVCLLLVISSVNVVDAKWVMFEGLKSEYVTEQFYDDSNVVQIADLCEFSVLVKVDEKLKKHIQNIPGFPNISYIMWRYKVVGDQYTMTYTVGYNQRMEVVEEGAILYSWRSAGLGTSVNEMKKIVSRRF